MFDRRFAPGVVLALGLFAGGPATAQEAALAAEDAALTASPEGVRLAAIARRINRVLVPLCASLWTDTDGDLHCGARPLLTTRRVYDGVQEWREHRVVLDVRALPRFETDDELAAVLAQKIAFAVFWQRSAGRIFSAARRNYFAENDVNHADAMALAAMQAGGFDPAAYLPALRKMKAMADATPPVRTYLVTPQPGLLSGLGEVSAQRAEFIEKILASLRAGNFAATLVDLKMRFPVRMADILNRDPARALGPRSPEDVLQRHADPARSAELLQKLASGGPSLLMVLRDRQGVRWFTGNDAEGRAVQVCVEQQVNCRVIYADSTLLFQAPASP